MKYSKYNSTNIRKNGIKRGKQNHICYGDLRRTDDHNPGIYDFVFLGESCHSS